jgi:ABC-type transporter Mla MlaB component
MFRITVVENPFEETWILQGQLTQEFVSELNESWRAALSRCSEKIRVVDLSDVTWIDKSGEEMLLKMIHPQTRFRATGLYTTHLLQELQSRTREK